MRMVCVAATLVLSAATLEAQRTPFIPTDTLALIDHKAITTRDFIERIELMPWPGKGAGRMDSAKIRALQSLVAEQLLADDALARGVGSDSSDDRRRTSLERLLVRDELYRREVVSRVTVSKEELTKGLRRLAVQLTVIFLRTGSRDHAVELSRLLSRTPGPDSSSVQVPANLVLEADSLTLTLGGLDWTLEDSAFALSMKRRVSQAVQSDYLGWGVIYLVDAKTNPAFANSSVPDRRSNAEKLLRRRKLDERAAEFTRTALAGQKAEAEPQLFEVLAREMHARILTEPSRHFKTSGFELLPGDLDSIAVVMAAALDSEIVRIPSGGITLRSLLESMQTQEMRFTSLDTTRFKNQLNGFIRSLVRAELLSRVGQTRGLQYSDNVTRDINVWTGYWRAAAVEQEIRAKVNVTDEETLAFLTRNARFWGDAYEVSVREILSNDLATAVGILDSLHRGADMPSLARRFSVRRGWKDRGGESGFFYVSSYPELGVPAVFLDSGRVAGPLQLRQGFSIFTTLGRRTHEGAMSLDSLRHASRNAARLEKAQREVNSYVANLAHDRRVTMYYDRLARVKVNPSSMVTKRYMGFGGVITAVPTIRPTWQWVKDAPGVREVLP